MESSTLTSPVGHGQTAGKGGEGVPALNPTPPSNFGEENSSLQKQGVVQQSAIAAVCCPLVTVQQAVVGTIKHVAA